MSKNQSEWTTSTCPYCGVGCGIEAKIHTSGKLEVRGDSQHPANYGRLCSKGLALGDTVATEGRMLSPSIEGQNCSWDDALSHVASSLSSIIEQHGPDAVAFYVSGQLLTEDYYVANKLMKGFIGSGNIDTNSRLCMASAVAGHKRAFGEDIVPGNYEDIELADLVVLTGSNLAWCHPVIYQRLKAAKEKRGTKIVVIDPRETRSCEIADLHLPLFSGSDIALFNGLLAYLVKHQHINQTYIDSHTVGFEQTLTQAQRFSTITSVALETGLKTTDIETFYQWFCSTPLTTTVFSQGINQSTSGTDKANSIINCHLATGRIGLPGSTPFSITGQPNAMGGREVGGLANTLAAHLEFGDDEHLSLVKDFWKAPTLATKPGLKAIDMFDAIEKGNVKAIWVMATNPAVSLPDSDRINRILSDCPLVIVSDCVADTETLRHANVCLPAQGWSEKSGTVTNSERRISRQRRLLPTPGEGKPDWWIVSEVAKRMGFHDAFNYQTEADIFREYVAQTNIGNRPEDRSKRMLNLSGLNGMTNEAYNDLSPIQWPVNSTTGESERLFSDGQFSTPDGKAKFITVDHQPPANAISERYGLILNTGRIRDQWHTMTRTGLSSILNTHDSEPMLEIHPFNASDRGIRDGQLVKVSSNISTQVFRASVTRHVLVGQCFAPIHWSQTHCSGGKTDALIPAITDPISGQPELKATPVMVQPMFVKTSLQICRSSPFSHRQLSQFCAEYWVKQKVSGGYVYQLQFSNEIDEVYATLLDSFLGDEDAIIQGGQPAQRRAVVFQQLKPTMAFSLFNIDSELRQPDIAQLLASHFTHQDIHAFLADSLSTRSPIICTCKQVTQSDIENLIAENPSIDAKTISELTLAGTGCGSCASDIEQCLLRACTSALSMVQKAG
ncbi:molybdopterin-dependent oxidoreductase [Enterovibrio sp. FF113]|uniref:molybdopterin-dependent oxidoreductase n=1 Tax=Enterovibrio sp. FF113 TaxID=3230010 RepID=UPI00352D4670